VTGVPDGADASAVTDEIGSSAGFVVSTTSTVNVALDVWPSLSVAEHKKECNPRESVVPEAGVHDGVSAPSGSSVALTPL
jgi:hypothetical protein